MLTFVLKKEWYDKIKSGEKNIEYRKVKPYWTNRIATEYEKELFEAGIEDRISAFFIFKGDNHFCKLRLGYTSKFMTAKINKIMIVDGDATDLCIDKPVYAIYLSNVMECK